MECGQQGQGQIWRAAFAFDPDQDAVVLVAAQKQGTDQKGFYKALIKKADKRFDSHLGEVKQRRAAEKRRPPKKADSSGAGKGKATKGSAKHAARSK